MSYKPLPEEVEIRDSGIEGKGLFAKVIIEEGTNLGMTHVSNPDFEDIHYKADEVKIIGKVVTVLRKI